MSNKEGGGGRGRGREKKRRGRGEEAAGSVAWGRQQQPLQEDQAGQGRRLEVGTGALWEEGGELEDCGGHPGHRTPVCH